MTRWIRTCLPALLAITSVCGVRGADEPGAGASDWQSQMLAEILRLRAEVAELSLEQLEARVARLTAELEAVRAQSRRAAEQDLQQTRSLAEVEQQLTTPELEPEVRPQVEALRNQLMTQDAQKSREERASLAQREADLTQRLRREIARRTELQERARQLQLSSGRK